MSIDDIYSYLPFNESIRNTLKELEQRIEEAIVVPNEVMVDVLDYCKEKGKTILITTDMYLPRATIESILKKNCISYDFIFLSNEIGETKLSGKLFPHLLVKLGIEANRIIHIGDNPVSDIQRASEAGISSCLREKKDIAHTGHYSLKQNDIFSNHISKYLEYKMSSRNKDVFYEIGYTVLGPILFELSEYIEYYRKKEGIQELAFVAREGFMLKKAYDMLYGKQRSRYVRINKNVLRFPSLHLNQSVDTFLDTIPSSHIYSWNTLLNYFPGSNFIPEDSNQEIKRNDILKGVYLEEFEGMLSQFNNQFKEQFDLLTRYLDQNNLLNKKVLLVNNSINGNGQSMLAKLCDCAGIQIELLGLQMVRSSKCRMKLGNCVKAYFEDKKMPMFYSSMFDYCTLLFEHLLFEDSGTAVELVNSDPVSVLCEPIGDEACNRDPIGRIQEAALEFIAEYKSCSIPIGKSAIYSFFDLFMRPSKEEVEAMKTIVDKEADTIEPLITRMKWHQAEMVLNRQNVSGYNRKLIIKSIIKSALDKLGLLNYIIK